MAARPEIRDIINHVLALPARRRDDRPRDLHRAPADARSVILPIKAIAMNALSIVASFGAMVFIFQERHLDWLFRFDQLGYVEASQPIILFCILFGLSMDYEVFLLSRIRERNT
ncbi:MAG: MMPL family transporter [Thermomicrobiales bacterium]